MGADTSPVNAPASLSCMVCAYTATCEPRAESTIACRARNAGQIAISTPCTLATRGSSPWMKASASATARVPAANGASSNAPIGPFQNTVPASRMASA